MAENSNIEWTTHTSSAEQTGLLKGNAVPKQFAGFMALGLKPCVQVAVLLAAIAGLAHRNDVAGGRSPAFGNWHHVIPTVGFRSLAVCAFAVEQHEQESLPSGGDSIHVSLSAISVLHHPVPELRVGGIPLTTFDVHALPADAVSLGGLAGLPLVAPSAPTNPNGAIGLPILANGLGAIAAAAIHADCAKTVSARCINTESASRSPLSARTAVLESGLCERDVFVE